MESQTLDDMLNSVPEIVEISRDYTSIDIYTSGAARMYFNWYDPDDYQKKMMTLGMRERELQDQRFGQIKINPPDGGIIPYGNLTGLGGDIHETFRIGNNGITGGHTTIKIPVYEPYRIPWGKK